MNHPRILVAGIGNIFLGDDAFGVEVVKRLAGKSFPAGVEVVDFGIRGLDLIYSLLRGYSAAILIDAIPGGQAPGTLYLIEPDPAEANEDDSGDCLIEAHSLDPARVLRLVRRMDGHVGRVLLVGCEPSPPDADDMCQGLSIPVAAAVNEAVSMVQELIERIYEEHLVT